MKIKLIMINNYDKIVKRGNFMKNIKHAFRALILLIKEYPLYILAEALSATMLVVQTLIPIKVSELIVLTVTNDLSFDAMVVEVLIYMGILCIATVINRVLQFYFEYISMNFVVKFSTRLFKKLDSIDYSFHESNKFLDNYTRALETGSRRIYNTAIAQVNLIKTLIQSASVFVILFQVHYLAVGYAIGIGIIYALIFFRISRHNFKISTIQRPFMRKRWYISRMYFVKDAIPDMKTTGIDDVLRDEHTSISNKIIENHDKYRVMPSVLSVIGEILMASIYPVVLGVVAYATLEDLPIATLTSLTVAASTLSGLIFTVASSITQIQNEAVECKIPFDVLDMESSIEGKGGIEVEEQFEKLEINKLSFTYEGSNKPALYDVSLHVKRGEKIAIVGENGAGKTTLVKLLLRLYDPSNGEIKIDNNSYFDTDTKSLRKHVGAVFQNNEVYSVSVAENILLRRVETKEDEELVVEALKFADIYDYVEKLPEGIHTVVTREFHRRGTIFSGGQVQKIAVARGYAQNYQLLILDEPSSALDPIAEAKMYHRMLELGRNRSLIFISHRLSATANVDRIYLFSEGTVKEAGTHDELMKLNGIYKEMFTSQAEKYLGGNDD